MYRNVLLTFILAWFIASPKLADGADEYGVFPVSPNIVHEPAIPGNLGTDDPQPDSISYHDGQFDWIIACADSQYLWASTRFTPLDTFELRAAYVLVYNPWNVPGRGMVYALEAATNGFPTARILARAEFPDLVPPSNTWIYIEFPEPVVFAGGHEFHLCYGPAPAGTYASGNGWWPARDNNQTDNRNYYAFGTHYQRPGRWQQYAFGDLMIMAGGEYLNPSTDLAAVNAFTADKKFWLFPGSDIVFKATVENTGPFEAGYYRAVWEVFDDTGSLIWETGEDCGPLSSETAESITCAQTWYEIGPGRYEISFYVETAGDYNPANDTTLLELYVTGLSDMPYTYVHEALSGDTRILRWGITFNLPETPARIDSFDLFLNEAGEASVSILLNDGLSGEPCSAIWELDTVASGGWNTFRPENINIYNDLFTVTYSGDSPLGSSSPGINSAANDSMMTTAWSQQAVWEKLYAGDWPFIVYLDTTSAPPAEAVLEVSADLIDFGAVFVGFPAAADFTMYNTGAIDPLQIINFYFSDPAIFSAAGFTPNTLIPAGDSLTVQLIFNPEWPCFYYEQMAILHNSPISQFPFSISVSGEGASEAGSRDSGELPAFEMEPIHPNPFNSQAVIEFSLPAAGDVRLTMYDITGREIAVFASGRFSSGKHQAVLHGSDLVSGIYFARLDYGEMQITRKLLLVK